jgi:serine protease Do
LKLGVQQLAENDAPAADVQTASRPPPRGLGMQLAALSPDLRQRFGVPETVAGAIVVSVDPHGFAAEHDVRAGDVVVSAGTQGIQGAHDFQTQADAARQAKRRFLLVGISRRGETSFKAVRLPGR